MHGCTNVTTTTNLTISVPAGEVQLPKSTSNSSRWSWSKLKSSLSPNDNSWLMTWSMSQLMSEVDCRSSRFGSRSLGNAASFGSADGSRKLRPRGWGSWPAPVSSCWSIVVLWAWHEGPGWVATMDGGCGTVCGDGGVCCCCMALSCRRFASRSCCNLLARCGFFASSCISRRWFTWSGRRNGVVPVAVAGGGVCCGAINPVISPPAQLWCGDVTLPPDVKKVFSMYPDLDCSSCGSCNMSPRVGMCSGVVGPPLHPYTCPLPFVWYPTPGEVTVTGYPPVPTTLQPTRGENDCGMKCWGDGWWTGTPWAYASFVMNIGCCCCGCCCRPCWPPYINGEHFPPTDLLPAASEIKMSARLSLRVSCFGE